MAAGKFYKVPKATKRYINQKLKKASESKYIFTSDTARNLTTTGVNVSVGDIATGAGDNARIGNQVKASGFYQTGVLKCNPSDTNPVMVRIVAYYARDNGSLLSTGTGVVGEIDPDQYDVLYDKLHTVAVGGIEGKVINIKLKLKNRIVRFSSDSSTSHVNNRLYIFYTSDVVANPPTYTQRSTYYYRE